LHIGDFLFHSKLGARFVPEFAVKSISNVLQAVLPPVSSVMLAGNKMMNKMVLVPMEPYTHFLAFTLCCAYVLCYGGALLALSMCAPLSFGLPLVARSDGARTCLARTCSGCRKALCCIDTAPKVYRVALRISRNLTTACTSQRCAL
jgi:hypothetical protein